MAAAAAARHREHDIVSPRDEGERPPLRSMSVRTSACAYRLSLTRIWTDNAGTVVYSSRSLRAGEGCFSRLKERIRRHSEMSERCG